MDEIANVFEDRSIPGDLGIGREESIQVIADFGDVFSAAPEIFLRFEHLSCLRVSGRGRTASGYRSH